MLKSQKGQKLKSMLHILLVMVMILSSVFPINHALAQVLPLEYYVSPTGNDSNQGTITQPFKTLEKARDTIRQLGTLPEGGVIVYLRGGLYNRENSFELTSQDSGTQTSPIVYKAYQNEVPILLGGKGLTSSNFSLVTDQSILNKLPEEARGKVYQINLQLDGITEYGSIKQVGFGWNKSALPPILQVDGKKQTLARYPNNGYMTINTVVNQGSIPRDGATPPYTGGTFTYTDSRADRWANSPEIWMFGYWKWDWADGTLRVSNLNASTNTISTVQPSYYGFAAGQRFYAFNLLEEIDIPGEYYIDRSTGVMYLYPENGSDITQSDVRLGLLETPLINLNGSEYITFEGIHFDNTCGKGISLMNCNDVKVKGNLFTRIGLWGIAIGDEEAAFEGTRLMDSESGGGRRNGAEDNLMYDLFAGGISIMGGNRTTLEAANNYAHNNQIFNYAQYYKTYNPAIGLNGVGNRATNNLIYDAPHQAIQFRGNDLLIEKNEIYEVLKETSDSGAIYTARDWTYQGNQIKYNYIHDIKTRAEQYAIYLDDLMSSAYIYGNIIYNVGNTGYSNLIGGGRDSTFSNNILIDCVNGGRWDNRGMNWANAVTLAPNGTCYQALLYVPYNQGIWLTKYPNLANILNDEREKPKYHTITNNVLYRTGAFSIDSNVSQYAKSISNNKNYTSNPGFVDEANKNWNLNTNSVIFRDIPGFQPIPFDEMGLEHELPFSIPVLPSPTTFDEGFETGVDGWNSTYGSASLSTAQKHSGGNSLIINEEQDVIQRSFGTNYNKVATMWFYDDASDTTSASVGRVDDSINWRALGTNTNISTTNYIVRVGSAQEATIVPRTTGWHELKWDYTSGTDLKMYIDGNLVKTVAGLTAFNSIAMGDWWTGVSSINYFDDIKFGLETVTPPTGLSDNLENGLSGWTTVKGTATTSTIQKHDGNYSYAVNEATDCISKTFAASSNKVVSMWFYDDASASSACVGRVDDNISWRAIGINSSVNATKYVVRVGSSWESTSIQRTTGWHELKWDYTSSTEMKMYIDGNLVKTVTGATTFNTIGMGDWWDSPVSNTLYFDDLKVLQ